MTSERVNFFFKNANILFLKMFKRDRVYFTRDECEMNELNFQMNFSTQ